MVRLFWWVGGYYLLVFVWVRVYSLDLLLAWRSRFSNFGDLGLIFVFDCFGVFDAWVGFLGV